MKDNTYIDPEQQRIYEVLKINLPSHFPHTNFQFNEWEDRVDLCWNDGPTKEEVIQFLTSLDIPYRSIFLTRKDF